MRTVSQNQNDSHRYDDMLKMPHHVSSSHHSMPMQERAAQFSPFAALAGYEEMIKEASKTTGERPVPDDEELAELDEKMQILKENLTTHPEVQFTVTTQDANVMRISGRVKQIKEEQRLIVLDDQRIISFDDMLEMDSDLFA